MRRYDIVSRILLILSIIDFALAAPVPVQEKRQARVDVVHIPRNVITLLWKRGDEELAKLAEGYFKPLGESFDSSEAHTSSSPAPLGPDHDSTNEEQVLAPNPPSSTANLNLLKEPSSPSSTASYGDALSDHGGWQDANDELDGSTYTSLLTDYGSVHELKDPPPPGPASPKEFAQAHEPQVGHVQQPSTRPSDPGPSNPGLSNSGLSNPTPPADSDFDWDFWTNLEDSPRPAPPVHAESDFRTLFDLPLKAWVWPFSKPWASKNLKPDPVQKPNRRPLMPALLRIGSWKGPDKEVAPGPPPSPALANPELNLDHQSLSTNSQPVDLQAAIYGAKGKTKELRPISGTAKNVGNAASDGVAA
jgi:hypothetical protein